MCLRQGRRRLLLLGASTVALLAPAATSHASVQLGTVPDITWGASRTDIDRTVAAVRDAGLATVRLHVTWNAVEPEAKGRYNTGWLDELDYAVGRSREAGLHVLAALAPGTPYWASADPAKHIGTDGKQWNLMWRPTRMADFGDFARFISRRWASLGVHDVEVWNEPNLHWFWPSGPNAREYVSMLRAAADALRATDPAVRVVLGGLSRSDWPFLEQIYDAGAAPWFDVVAVHPYTGAVDPSWCWDKPGTGRRAPEAFCALREVRATMEARGDGAKPVWLTEFGWTTASHEYGVTEDQQASYLRTALHELDGMPFVTRAYWYSLRDWGSSDPGALDAHYGLLRHDFSAKPALAVVREHTATPDTGQEPAPVPPATEPPSATDPAPAPPANTPPVVALASPVDGATFTSNIPMSATAHDDRGVVRVEFRFDGKLVATDTAAPYSASYSVPRKTSLGDHRVTATAVDTDGARSGATLVVRRVSTSRRAKASASRSAARTSSRCTTTKSNALRGAKARGKGSKAGSTASKTRGKATGARGGSSKARRTNAASRCAKAVKARGTSRRATKRSQRATAGSGARAAAARRAA